MFKFNFQIEPEESKSIQNQDPHLESLAPEEPFHEHSQPSCEDTLFAVQTVNFKISDNEDCITVKYTDCKLAIEHLGNAKSGKVVELSKDSDLITGVYEGGLKIWECAIDLASYVASSVDVKDLQVLELGCGAGLPGIVAGVKGAREIHFQDYNGEVIDHITIPNVLSNQEGYKYRFFSGDWKCFRNEFEKKVGLKYDIILTSETIYNAENYQKLIDVFESCLEDNGIILLAAKIHYFGVGGGMRLFEKEMQKSGLWKFKTVVSFQEGVAREIVKISRNSVGC